MNTAEEYSNVIDMSVFRSAVRPAPEPKPPPPSMNSAPPLSFNEIIMSHHAGSPYFTFFRPDPERIKELYKTQPDYKFSWYCAICGAVPPVASMIMLGPQASMCDSCYTSIHNLFPF